MSLDKVFEKVVFLLGAGASKGAGCQLSNEMLESLQGAINDLDSSDVDFFKNKESFNEIYHFILASLHYQSTMKDFSIDKDLYANIEDFVMVLRQLIDKEFIIPYPLIGNWNEKILRWEIQNKNVFSEFKDFITFQLVNRWTNFEQDKAEALLAPIREFLNNSENLKMNVFSLNYDLVFEKIFNTNTLKILDNGFSERTISDNKIKNWSADFNDQNSSTKINLYKLHGSLDWEYSKDTEEISIKDNVFDGKEPLIIFGSHSKMLSFDPFLYLLSAFREKLSSATIFIVIGYSFHDKYINNLLIQQLSQNTIQKDIPKKLIMVGPTYKEKTQSDVAEELKNIQDSKSINDVINFKQISPDRIKLIGKSAFEFYSEYFSNNGEILIRELESTEKGDNLFE